jgi:Rrf2 family transcriptional regulator, iron-sulfur cluster assembly transcription factor
MEVSTKGRYAVMALVDLASHGGEARPVSLAEIAARQEISQSYLEQLFARLRRKGLVTAVRGPGGGYRLSRPASQTDLAGIMRAVDEPLRVTRCEMQAREGCLSGERRCATHDLWDELSRHIAQFLGNVSVADVVNRQVAGRAFHYAAASRAAAQ